MPRIECSCGKVLKVSDESAGKKIKCPGCGEFLSVPKSSAVSTRPLAPGGRNDEHEENDAGDGESVAKKGGFGLLLPILGCLGLLFFVAVLGAGIAAYFLFFKADEPTSAEASTPTKDGKDAVDIVLRGPRKAGDIRLVTFKSSSSTSAAGQSIDTGKADGRIKVKTLKVDGGKETEWEVNIQELTAPGIPVSAGTVLVGKLTSAGTKTISWTNKKDKSPYIGFAQSYLDRVCRTEIIFYNGFVRLVIDDDDAMFGTKEKMAVGSTWPGNLEMVKKAFTTGVMDKAMDVTSLNGTLARVWSEGANRFGEAEITVNMELDSTKAPGGAGTPGSVKGPCVARVTYQFLRDNPQSTFKFAYVVGSLGYKNQNPRPANRRWV